MASRRQRRSARIRPSPALVWGSKQDELVASVAGAHVGAAELGPEDLGHRGDGAIPRAVAEGVVDRLQVIHVGHDAGEGRAVAPGAADLVVEAAPEGAQVGEAGQGVGLGQRPEVGLPPGEAKRALDAGPQLLERGGLLNEVGGAQVEGAHPRGVVGVSGEEDDRDLGGVQVPAKGVEHGEAVDPGKAEVEHDQVGNSQACRGEGLVAIGDHRHLVVGLQPRRDGLALVVVVLGDEDAGTGTGERAGTGVEVARRGHISRRRQSRRHAQEVLGQVRDGLGIHLEQAGAGVTRDAGVGGGEAPRPLGQVPGPVPDLGAEAVGVPPRLVAGATLLAQFRSPAPCIVDGAPRAQRRW